MQIRIKLYKDGNIGYSADITGWRHRLIRQLRSESLWELGELITDYINPIGDDRKILGRFIEEEILTCEGAKTEASELYKRFLNRCGEVPGMKLMTMTKFGITLGKSFEKTKMNGKIYYCGVALRKR
jgi:hypothetical protein